MKLKTFKYSPIRFCFSHLQDDIEQKRFDTIISYKRMIYNK